VPATLPKPETSRATAPPTRRVWIDKVELVRRLSIRSDSVVDEIYDIAKQQLDDEDKRDGILNTKANTVLGASGLSLTVAFTFGGFLLQHPERLALGPPTFYLVVAAFAASMLLGLLAGLFALFGMKVGQYEYINEGSIFDVENLGDVDRAFEATWTSSKGDRAAANQAALSTYRRYLAGHLWGIYQRTFEKLERRAEWIKWAQRAYLGFLATIMVLGLELTASALGIKPGSDRREQSSVTVTTPALDGSADASPDVSPRTQPDASLRVLP
jgi:hypothetical protein